MDALPSGPPSELAGCDLELTLHHWALCWNTNRSSLRIDRFTSTPPLNLPLQAPIASYIISAQLRRSTRRRRREDASALQNMRSAPLWVVVNEGATNALKWRHVLDNLFSPLCQKSKLLSKNFKFFLWDPLNPQELHSHSLKNPRLLITNLHVKPLSDAKARSARTLTSKSPLGNYSSV